MMSKLQNELPGKHLAAQWCSHTVLLFLSSTKVHFQRSIDASIFFWESCWLETFSETRERKTNSRKIVSIKEWRKERRKKEKWEGKMLGSILTSLDHSSWIFKFYYLHLICARQYEMKEDGLGTEISGESACCTSLKMSNSTLRHNIKTGSSA